MKIFTKKALREHDIQIIDEMMEKRFMAERMERLENRMMELEMRMERMQPSTKACNGNSVPTKRPRSL